MTAILPQRSRKISSKNSVQLSRSFTPISADDLCVRYWRTIFSSSQAYVIKQRIDNFIQNYGIDRMLYYSSGVICGTLLSLAASDASLDIIRYLVEEKKANINIHGNSNYIPIMVATREKRFIEADYLLSQGANVQQYPTLKLLRLFWDINANEQRNRLLKNLLLHGDTLLKDEFIFREQIIKIETLQRQLLLEYPWMVLKNNRLIDGTEELLTLIHNRINEHNSTAFFLQPTIQFSRPINESTFNVFIKQLEKKGTPLAFLACGLLLEGHVESETPARYLDNETEEAQTYLTKRIHDAISCYHRAATDRQLIPVVSALLWNLRIETASIPSLQIRLAQYDLSSPISHKMGRDAVSIPLLKQIAFFAKQAPSDEMESMNSHQNVSFILHMSNEAKHD